MASDPKDLGILFRGDMVRAILAGEKRVTRRAMTKPTVRLGNSVCPPVARAIVAANFTSSTEAP